MTSDYEHLNLFFILSQSITIKSEEIMLRDPGPHQTIKVPHPKSPMDILAFVFLKIVKDVKNRAKPENALIAT